MNFFYKKDESIDTVYPSKSQYTILYISFICLCREFSINIVIGNVVIAILFLYTGSEGGVPRDGSAVTQFVTYHLALVIPYYILATAGLVFCTVCLVFNFTQRNKR